MLTPIWLVRPPPIVGVCRGAVAAFHVVNSATSNALEVISCVKNFTLGAVGWGSCAPGLDSLPEHACWEGLCPCRHQAREFGQVPRGADHARGLYRQGQRIAVGRLEIPSQEVRARLSRGQ